VDGAECAPGEAAPAGGRCRGRVERVCRRIPRRCGLGRGLKDSTQKAKVLKMAKKAVVARDANARKGEADRTIVNLRPKHLFSGKRGIGKTDRR